MSKTINENPTKKCSNVELISYLEYGVQEVYQRLSQQSSLLERAKEIMNKDIRKIWIKGTENSVDAEQWLKDYSMKWFRLIGWFGIGFFISYFGISFILWLIK